MPTTTSVQPPRPSPGPGPGASAGGEGAGAPTSKLSELLGQLLEPIVRLTGAKAAAVRELTGDHQHFGYLASLGLPAQACGSLHPMDRHCGACGRAADISEVVWARDLSGCSAAVRPVLAAEGQERLLVVPLQHRGRLLGVYNLFFDAQQAEPSSNAKAMLRAMGELLGMALNNALIEADEHRHQLTLERQRMAAEVHDSVAQSVAFMKMRLALLEDALKAGQTDTALTYCQELRGVASESHASLRIVLTHFRQATESLPVAQVLAARVEQWHRDSDIHFTLENHTLGPELDPEQASELIHIVQEAVTNVIRHSRATQARVQLRDVPGGQLEAVVEDNGTGFGDPDHPGDSGSGSSKSTSTHYGLEIMRERAHRLHGTLEFTPREGGGTRVRLVFPAQAATAASPHRLDDQPLAETH